MQQLFSSVILLLILSSCAHIERRVSLPESLITPRPRVFNQQHLSIPGVNIAGDEENFDTLLEAKRLGVSFIILTPSQWRSAHYPEKSFTFLLGKNAHYEGLIKKDVERLRHVLDWASLLDLKVVLSFSLVPGYFDLNNTDKNTLFVSPEQQAMAFKFFHDIAIHIGDHEALIGINPLSAPMPEQVGLVFNNQISHNDWYKKIHNSEQDLNKFYRQAVKSIRKARNQLPIILSAGLASSPSAFDAMQPINDADIIYSFSWPATATKKETIELELKPVIAWQKKHNIDSDRILVSSFGINRDKKDAKETLKLLHDVFREHRFIQAFSGFREKGQEHKNIELSAEQENPTFWQAIKEGVVCL